MNLILKWQDGETARMEVVRASYLKDRYCSHRPEKERSLILSLIHEIWTIWKEDETIRQKFPDFFQFLLSVGGIFIMKEDSAEMVELT